MLSSLFPHSYLLERDVYLIDKLDNVGREGLAFLKCLVFVRPTPANLEVVVEELRAPRYAEYHLCSPLPSYCFTG